MNIITKFLRFSLNTSVASRVYLIGKVSKHVQYDKEAYPLYKTVSGLGALVRIFLLPNPFASHPYGAFLNLLAEPVIQIITYWVVSLFYERGSMPAWGSFLYFLFYALHIGLIEFMGQFGFQWAAIVLLSIVYGLTLAWLSNKFR